MEILAYGKVNPALNVGRTREDGFHEVQILMQQVDLYDRILLEKEADEGEEPHVSFSCSVDLGIPDEKNLAVKAARLMQEKYHLPSVAIYLEKKLPAAAGMAGGSTDAAAVIRGMNELFEAGLSVKEMEETAAALGSDIPYCITGGTAICTGRGEIVTRIAPMPLMYLLVFKPDFGVSTPWAYKVYREEESNPPADIEAMVRSIEESDMEAFAEGMRNQLYAAVMREHPVLDEIIDVMEEAGAMKAMMTGSGPTVFALFSVKEERDRAEACVRSALEKKSIAGTLFAAQTRNSGDVNE